MNEDEGLICNYDSARRCGFTFITHDTSYFVF